MPGNADSHPPLARALLRPNAYPERVEQVRMAETHVSWLFFTDRHVYKVKKPVDYGFLDFTTLEKRRHFCEREVELNSRLSPDVYLGVVSITRNGDRLSIEGKGEVVEYAVKMRRLPEGRAMNELLKRGLVSAGDVRALAARIADFHARAASGPEITRLGDLAVVRENVEQNIEQTAPYVGVCLSEAQFDDLVEYSRAFMDARAETFNRRASEGRIRDGHGDLHAANVFLDNGIHIIDCIEFNDRFRCGDVAEDIAFLAMDLDFYGRTDLSSEFVVAYVEASGDPGLLELLDFFKVYRAWVRGKVTAFRLNDSSLPEGERGRIQDAAKSYFDLAHSYAKQAIPRPLLILMTGLMGSGKTYLSERLAARWQMAHISSDVTRKALAGIGSTERRYEDFGKGIYSPAFTRRTYDAMLEQARERLRGGESVILDASFSKRDERQQALDMAKDVGAAALVVECAAPDDEIARRLTRRVEGREPTASDGRLELYYQQKAVWEPTDDVPERACIRLDTSSPPQDTLRTLLYEIFKHSL